MRNLFILFFMLVISNLASAQLIDSLTINTDSVALRPVNRSIDFQPIDIYKWAIPALETINVDSIKQNRKDYENYLKDIDFLETRLKNNRKELSIYVEQAKNESKRIETERKMRVEKLKFLKLENKLLKEEQSLRDKELKAYKKERKDFIKLNSDLDTYQKDERFAKFDEKERQILSAANEWKIRSENWKNNLSKLEQDKILLDNREKEVFNRQIELQRLKESLDLKEKQLNNERKQARLEIKKAKALLKIESAK